MAKPSVRTAQLISPFGVGALCEADGQSFFVRGTGSWSVGGNLQEIAVAALTGRLRPRKLKRPIKSVAVTRFPRWHFCPVCRAMKYWSHQDDQQRVADDASLPRPECSGAECKQAKLVPMRFVAVCDNGHLDEIDWYWWGHRQHQQAVHGACDRRTARLRFEVTGASGGDFNSMLIYCSCGSSGSLEGIADGPLPQRCEGRQPGESPIKCLLAGKNEAAPLFMEPRGSSALHYPSVLSALDIAGDTDEGDFGRLRGDAQYQSFLTIARNLVSAGQAGALENAFRRQVEQVGERIGIKPEASWGCFWADVIASDEADEGDANDVSQATLLDEEFPVLARSEGQKTRWLVTRPEPLGAGLATLLQKSVRVERLREVRAFRGFQRRNVTEQQAMISPSLGRPGSTWLPAIQVLGEGIFLEFPKDSMAKWLSENQAAIENYTHQHLINAERIGIPGRMGFNASPAFIMVHTFSHLLINQLAFDCGYSSTSLRERIYCGPPNNLYAGILIYTADSDAEGSMGGLSEMGSPNRIEDVIYRAVARSNWCSGDPVCRELESQGMDGLNRAACHACSLVAETSCTYSNMLLDRVLVSGDGRVNGRGSREPLGYFHALLGS